MSAEARQRALRRRRLQAGNARPSAATVVLVVEDLHWMDEASDMMLGELVGAVEGTQTLAIVNFRPEYPPDWSGPARLPPGRARAARAKPHPRSCCATSPAKTPRSTGSGSWSTSATAGNPFFIEEIVRELAESGYLEGERGAYRLVRPVEDTGVPPTVQAVLAARIDRLGARRRRCCRSPRWSARRSRERRWADRGHRRTTSSTPAAS